VRPNTASIISIRKRVLYHQKINEKAGTVLVFFHNIYFIYRKLLF
jgi:hypothetical protein